MSVVTAFMDRIGGEDTPFALIEGAAELAAVADEPPSTPAAYVLTAREASQPSPLGTGGVYQRMERDIAVVIVTSNLADDQGAAASREIETLKAFVRGRVIGWTPGPDDEPVEHVNGEIVQAAGGTVWFEDVFATATYLKGA